MRGGRKKLGGGAETCRAAHRSSIAHRPSPIAGQPQPRVHRRTKKAFLQLALVKLFAFPNIVTMLSFFYMHIIYIYDVM